ncbi:helix-turn-helix domain-containing protein [Pseudomonas fluorescens]|uniref:helix-turn-helix domain-containing protein n=1 Tax=Pseudomonas TaxID=286 RepID=UPI003D01F9B4
MFVDAYATQPVDYTSSPLYGRPVQLWTSEASAPISEQIGAILVKNEYESNWTGLQPTRKNSIVFVNKETADIRISLTTTTSLKKEKNKDNTNVILFADQLEAVQEKMKLSITQVAELFGVTRKTVYDWYEGKTTPRSAASNRLEILSEITNSKPKNFDIGRLKTVWNVPISGKSFLSVIQDENLNPVELREEASKKLAELGPRLAPTAANGTAIYLGDAHTSDVDRDTNAV